jgi:hypothetical protein
MVKHSFIFTIHNILPFILLALVLVNVSVYQAHSQDDELESPKRVLAVKDYKWGSGGMGRAAILSEVTIENRGKYDYENIALEADFYTSNGIPLGSLRGTIHQALPAGSEKTFYNVKFGMMHAELKDSVVRVVNADLIEGKGTPLHAKDLIQVKNYEWTGGRYGTEGILKEITLVNKSDKNWKDMKIRVDYLGIPGPKVGIRGFTSRAVIHDILPAHSERTYTGINVGFKHPDANSIDISVMSAKSISEKETQIKLARKEGKKAVKIKKKKTAPGEAGEGTIPEEEQELSLSERYKQRLAAEKGEPVGETGTETTTASEPEGAETPSVKESMTAKTEETETGTETAETGVDEGEEEYEYVYEEDVPLPEEDIVVDNFKWGGGVTGTIGKISEITLRNISGITYSKIELKIEFYSYNEQTPMYSNRATINEVLPANSTKTFENVKAGYLNAIPQEVRIVVLTAQPFAQ